MSADIEHFSSFCQALGIPSDEMKSLVDYYSAAGKDNEDALWSTRFRPSISDLIIGNKEAVAFVKSWLSDWARKPPIELNANGTPSRSKKRKVRLDDSDSDFLPNSDEESNDDEDNVNRALLIAGPCGCGKTSAVYTLCQEQGFKVVEINASSIRSGKILTEQFKAATGLHRVDANCLLKESFFNSEVKPVTSDDKINIPSSKKNGENVAVPDKSKPDVKAAFQKLFGGASSKPKAEVASGKTGETTEPKREKSKSSGETSSSKGGPLDGWIARPKAKAAKDSEKSVSVVPEMPVKSAKSKSSLGPDHAPPSGKSGKKRKSSKASNVIVVESDDEEPSAVDSIVIEDDDDDDEDFQVKKRRKKPSSKKQKQAKLAASMEDSDVEPPVVKHVRPSAGLTLELKTLYLIDEADLIFADSDVGFASALCRLISTGEKPFILTASTTQGIENSLLNFCIFVEMTRPSEDELCKHLAAMTLSMKIDHVSVSSLKDIARSSKCDIRMALNSLNFNPSGSLLGSERMSNGLPDHLPDRSIVRKLMFKSELDVLFGEISMRWDTNGSLLKDSMEDLPMSNYRNIIELRDELKQGAGNTLSYLLNEFTSIYSSRFVVY